MWCRRCGDMISPNRRPREPRACKCGTFHVWWENPQAGIIRVHARSEGFKHDQLCYILGLHNGFIQFEARIDPNVSKFILDRTPDTYLFKQQNSMVCRFEPGETGDSAWADSLPEAAIPHLNEDMHAIDLQLRDVMSTLSYFVNNPDMFNAQSVEQLKKWITETQEGVAKALDIAAAVRKQEQIDDVV